jgi:anhydro-N-acetylmuramic acid kinase
MLSNVGRRQQRYVAGLMSGTSLDGVDAVLLRVRGSGAGTQFSQVAHVKRSYPPKLRVMLLRNSVPETSRVDEIARLNVLLAHIYADAIRALARKARVKLTDIALIGSHGQTIHHLPEEHRMFGKPIRATLQIGDPSVLATLTGIPTVGDFRLADMAVGGQGAPLVPYFDWLVFRSRTKNRLLLNIGGIANITVLPAKCKVEDVVAFDTGPGNMVVDALMQRLYGKPFDRNGATASRGMVAIPLLRRMMKHPFLKQHPPKSTGREMFGERYVAALLREAQGYAKEDIIATVSQFTAEAVREACTRFASRGKRIDELIVSGGGARNRFILGALQSLFPSGYVKTSDDFNISSHAKEAVCFAILANETITGVPANVPSVTGAKRKVVLGVISRPVR